MKTKQNGFTLPLQLMLIIYAIGIGGWIANIVKLVHLLDGGFGCEMTGGHCVPSEYCQSRREEAQRQDEFKAMIQMNMEKSYV